MMALLIAIAWCVRVRRASSLLETFARSGRKAHDVTMHLSACTKCHETSAYSG